MRTTIDYTTGHAVSWLYQTASAIHYMHTFESGQYRTILHRDINSKNILLTQNYLQVKLTDFNTATQQRPEMTQGVGTLSWMAPQVGFVFPVEYSCKLRSL
jgi:serine/threonine protein kinase